MYSLIMTSGQDDWNNPTWILSSDRFLEYTNDAIALRFKPLSDLVLEHLKSLPTLFAYEHFHNAPARVGRVTEIQLRQSQMRITLAIDQSVPPISFEKLVSLYQELDIGPKWEANRTHWAIKDVNLEEVLSSAGIIAKTSSLRPQLRPPKVFLSYSWDSPEHRQWVAQFGGHLRGRGIDVVLDQWHVRGGEDLAAFMERSIREADRVLVICTENYVEKAMGRNGGVGYEHMMVTGELMQNVGTTKFVPIVRQSRPSVVLPRELSTRLYFDLSDGPHQTERMESLVRDLLDARLPIPPLGPNPYSL